MKGFVGDLVALVGGSANGAKRVSHAEVAVPSVVTSRAHVDPADKSRSKEVAVHQAREVTPEQVIPLDDNDFKDF